MKEEEKKKTKEVPKFEKIGNYISDKRINKLKITQEKLAERVGVSTNQISKWERGLREPDSERMQILCKVLDVSIYELLEGRDLKKNYDPRYYDEITIKGIKFFVSKAIKKTIFICSLVMFFIIFLFAGLIFIFNTYKWKLYKIDTDYNDFKIHGYVLSNKTESIYNFNNILYTSEDINTDDEPLVLNLKVSLYLNNEELYSYEIMNDDYIPIHYCLRNLRIEVDKNDIEYNKSKELYVLLEFESEHDEMSTNKIILK